MGFGAVLRYVSRGKAADYLRAGWMFADREPGEWNVLMQWPCECEVREPKRAAAAPRLIGRTGASAVYASRPRRVAAPTTGKITTLRYVLRDQVGNYLGLGWEIASDLADCHHGEWSVLMKEPHDETLMPALRSRD